MSTGFFHLFLLVWCGVHPADAFASPSGRHSPSRKVQNNAVSDRTHVRGDSHPLNTLLADLCTLWAEVGESKRQLSGARENQVHRVREHQREEVHTHTHTYFFTHKCVDTYSQKKHAPCGIPPPGGG